MSSNIFESQSVGKGP